MGYSNYKKLEQVTKKFGFSAKRQRIFDAIQPVEPSSWLVETLSLREILPLSNEKSKSERIVSPILSEVAKYFVQYTTFFSGEILNIQPEDNLAGECDFLFTLTPQSEYLESPIISVVEAKDEDIDWGIAQCAAQLYGVKLFNEQEGNTIPVLYGCATDGIQWRFMRFERTTFHVDNRIYTDLQEILGIWHTILNAYTKHSN